MDDVEIFYCGINDILLYQCTLKLNLKNLIKLRVNRKQVGSDRLANAIGTMEKNKN